MIGAIARRIFGSANERYIKRQQQDVAAVNALEPEVERLSDDELRALYSDRFAFTDDGLPLVTVEIVSGRTSVELDAARGVDVLDHRVSAEASSLPPLGLASGRLRPPHGGAEDDQGRQAARPHARARARLQPPR